MEASGFRPQSGASPEARGLRSDSAHAAAVGSRRQDPIHAGFTSRRADPRSASRPRASVPAATSRTSGRTLISSRSASREARREVVRADRLRHLGDDLELILLRPRV